MSEELVIVAEAPALLALEVPVVGYVTTEASGLPGLAGKDSLGLVPMPFSKSGTMDLSTGAQRFPVDYDVEVLSAHVYLGTPPLGSEFALGINVNGALAIHLAVPAGQHDVAASPTGLSIAAGSLLSVDRLAIGSIFPGADLTVVLWMKALA
jgi:hypothetical protein